MAAAPVDNGDGGGSAFRRAPARSAGTMVVWEQEAEADAAAARAGTGAQAAAARTPASTRSTTVLVSSTAPSVGGPRTAAGSSSPESCSASGSQGPVADLALLLEGAREVACSDWHSLPGRQSHEALDVVEQLERTFAAMRADLVAAIDVDGLWALDGQRTLPAWLRTRTDTTTAAASRHVRTARALRDHLPLTRAALAAGRISAEHVAVLVREVLRTDRLRAQLTDTRLGEAFLVDSAAQMDAETFAKVVRAWAVAADPEAADRAWRDAGAKEEFTLAHTLGGYHVAGWLDEVSGQVLATALGALMGRKGKDDERTPAQRRAAALVALARQALDSGRLQPHGRIRPHLTVTTSWETFQALVAASGSVIPPLRSDGQPYPPGAAFGISADKTLTAPGGPRDPGAGQGDLFALSEEARQWLQQWAPGDDHVIPTAIDPRVMTGVEPATLPDGTPLSPALLARLACSSGLTRVVFGPDSTVLDVGREQRIFPAHMVKAITARDKHCQYPDCHAPPGVGEIHHALQWYRDHGPTSVDLGILLCWHHHDRVHAHNITIARTNGRWYFYDRHGWLITPRHDHNT